MRVAVDKVEALLIVTMALLIARAEVPFMARTEARTDKVVTQLMVLMERRVDKLGAQHTAIEFWPESGFEIAHAA